MDPRIYPRSVTQKTHDIKKVIHSDGGIKRLSSRGLSIVQRQMSLQLLNVLLKH